MKYSELRDKAIRLCEGGIVEVDGHFVKAEVVDESDCPCYVCEMDSVCRTEFNDLCTECDSYDRKHHILKFAYQ